jgi:cytochrome b561
MKTYSLAFSITRATTLVLVLLVFSFPSIALAGQDGDHGSEISWFSFIKPLGLCALSCALVTFATGLFRRKIGKQFLRIHKTFAWLTVAFALCHGILVLSLF